MIQNITILGAGTMGHGIAHTFSRHGYRVNLYEPFDAVRESVMEKICAELQFMVEEGCITQSEAELGLRNVTLFSDLEEASKDADYVLEVCPEKLELKRELFLKLDRICSAETVFATNTSSLRLADVIEPLPETRKARCMVCHWYNPAYLMPIAELSKFGNMPEETFQAVYELYVKCGKQPVRVLKDIPGMIANRLLHAQAREAFYLLELGAADREDLDRALKYGPGFRSATTGMLETADMGGLDIWLAGEDNLLPHLCNDTRACASLRGQVERGRLGVKNGKGFFDYPEEVRDCVQKEFYHRLVVQLMAARHYG